ncbi:hypothetical protein GmHk_U059532 [Glycine max]|nr:hypothetical protein GmHk_U059532 [Glycine max]
MAATSHFECDVPILVTTAVLAEFPKRRVPIVVINVLGLILIEKLVFTIGAVTNKFDHIFVVKLTNLLDKQGAVGPAKPADRPDHEVDDSLYLMTLTIPQLFLKPSQVMWDATVFGVFNEHFPLYIKNEDLSEIAHDGQCLSISIIQLHMIETSMRAGNAEVYGFLERQSIQRSRQSPDNHLKGIINSALKGLDDTPQPKSKAGARWIVVKCNRQKGSTECGYCVMHWMSIIILGSFKNNWETVIIYFKHLILL